MKNVLPFETKYDYVKEFLEKSVEDKSKLLVSEPALRGYINGDPIQSLANDLFGAGINQNKITEYLQSLYDIRHKDTLTFNNRYHGQTYKEALYEKAQKDFTDITMDNLAENLSKAFFDLIQAAANPVQNHSSDIEVFSPLV